MAKIYLCHLCDLPGFQIVFEGADNRDHGIGLYKIRVSADFDGYIYTYFRIEPYFRNYFTL